MVLSWILGMKSENTGLRFPISSFTMASSNHLSPQVGIKVMNLNNISFKSSFLTRARSKGSWIFPNTFLFKYYYMRHYKGLKGLVSSFGKKIPTWENLPGTIDGQVGVLYGWLNKSKTEYASSVEPTLCELYLKDLNFVSPSHSNILHWFFFYSIVYFIHCNQKSYFQPKLIFFV